jgi:hypothetical protein
LREGAPALVQAVTLSSEMMDAFAGTLVNKNPRKKKSEALPTRMIIRLKYMLIYGIFRIPFLYD